MTRKISNAILLSFLITCSNYIIAGTQGLLISNFNGFYAGGSVGGVFNNAREFTIVDGGATFPEFFLGNTNLTNTNLTDRGVRMQGSAVIGQLYAGYGRTWQMFYLGGEVFGNLSQYKMQNFMRAEDRFNLLNDLGGGVVITAQLQTNATLSTNLKISPLQWGGDLRSGFLATPDLLLYGRVGVASSKISLSNTLYIETPSAYQIEAFSISQQFFSSAGLRVNSSKNVAALRLGAGLEYSMNSQWSLRMDYIYVYYGKVNTASNFIDDIPSDPPFDPNQPPLFGPGILEFSHTKHVRTIQSNTVMFGISYYPQVF